MFIYAGQVNRTVSVKLTFFSVFIYFQVSDLSIIDLTILWKYMIMIYIGGFKNPTIIWQLKDHAKLAMSFKKLLGNEKFPKIFYQVFDQGLGYINNVI